MPVNAVRCRQMILIGLILLEAALIWMLLGREKPMTEVDWLTAYTIETDAFRAMDFGKNGLVQAHLMSSQWETDVYSILAAGLVRDAVAEKNNNEQTVDGFSLDFSYKECRQLIQHLQREKPIEWTKLVNGFRTILADIQYFPVAADAKSGLSGIAYENGWGDPRTYGGDRLHEGTDIMDISNSRGSHPIVSMTEGVVEHIGWLEQGGYRIGIRSPHGAYVYYAHLDSYAEPFAVGQEVRAGQIIGFMGDTGYSTVEGTVGNFPVHLHLGIYLETDHYNELSVNPYYILKYLENRTVSYTKETHIWYNIAGYYICTDRNMVEVHLL